MVDGIGSPHCADIATAGSYRQFPWKQWTANEVVGRFPNQYDTNHIGQWRKWLRKTVEEEPMPDELGELKGPHVDRGAAYRPRTRCRQSCPAPSTQSSVLLRNQRAYHHPSKGHYPTIESWREIRPVFSKAWYWDDRYCIAIPSSPNLLAVSRGDRS